MSGEGASGLRSPPVPSEDDDEGADLLEEEEMSDLEKDQRKFVRWLRARHAQERAGVRPANYGEVVEEAQLEELKAQARRRSSVELGELEERSASAEEHVRRFSFNGDCVSTIKAHEDAVNCITTLDNGNIVTGSEDTFVKVKSHPSIVCDVC